MFRINYEKYDKISRYVSANDILLLIIFSVIYYIISYIKHPSVPGNNEIVWMGWFDNTSGSDQYAYWKSALDLSNFRLTPESYIYPLGYPFLGALFIQYLPRHPFLVPNMVCAVSIVVMFYMMSNKLLSKIESFLICLFFVFLSGFITDKYIPGGLIWDSCLVFPWNLIPPFAIYYIVGYNIIFRRVNMKIMTVCSILIAFAMLCRPPSALFLMVIYLAGVLEFKNNKEKILSLCIFGISCSVSLAIAVISKLYTFGSIYSRYDHIMKKIGFNITNIGFKLYSVFIDAMPLYNYSENMLAIKMPWMFIVIPGIVIIGLKVSGKIYYLVAAILSCIIFYLSFETMVPTNIYTYHGYRYFAWIFPLLGLFAYISITKTLKYLNWKRSIIPTILLVVIVFSFGWKEESVLYCAKNNDKFINQNNCIYEQYEHSSMTHEIGINIPPNTNIEAIRLYLTNMSYIYFDSNNWHKISISLDNRQLFLYADFNIIQFGNRVAIVLSNEIKKKNYEQEFKIYLLDTKEPKVEKVVLLKKKISLFSMVKRLATKTNMAPLKWRLTVNNNIQYNEYILFGNGGNSNNYKMKGWSVAETQHTWTIGNTIALGFIVPRTDKDIIFKFTANGLIALPDIPFQLIEFYVNGNKIESVQVSAKKEYSVVIPNQTIQDDHVIIIQMKIPSAISPKALRYNEDTRELGIAFYSGVLETI